MKLGKLTEVDIREVWKHEQYDFSKWLAQEENIKELGDTLNLSLTDIETEKFVGNFRCDIICKDELTGKGVLIENQLESTNHDHLGKIITYAASLDAGVVVWIVSSARQEHASAIEWLNNHTTTGVDFFLLEIHAYTIGDSELAPMFTIIEKPNDFTKTTKSYANSGTVREVEVNRMEFWTRLNDAIVNNGKPFNTQKATTNHWYNVAVGSSKCHIAIDLVNKEHRIRIGFWIHDDKDFYDYCYSHKDEIENAFGEKLDWDRLDERKTALFYKWIPGLNFKKQDNYPVLISQIIKDVVKLREAVKPFIN